MPLLYCCLINNGSISKGFRPNNEIGELNDLLAMALPGAGIALGAVA